MRFLKNKLAVTVLLLSVSFLVIIGLSVERKKSSFAESGIGLAINQIQGKVYKVSSNSFSFVDFFTHYSDVKKENEKLKKKNAELLNMEQNYKILQDENDRYSKVLAFEQTRDDYTFKGADIVRIAAGGWIDRISINVGSKDGIAAGMVVVNEEGCLVGKITIVASNWSTLETIANSNFAVSGEVPGNPNDNGVVKGYRGNNNKVLGILSSIPKESEIKNGDVVVTRGLDGNYPVGIRIGTVTSVQENKGKLEKNAIIQPFVDFNKLQKIEVIIPNNIRDIKY